jgi:tetratricopeptide (TPR) repeat protein
MKNIDEHIDLIERYLYDDLSRDELAELNKKLKTDPSFNKLFHEMDHLLEGIRRSAKQTTVEEKLANLEASLPLKEKTEYDTPVIPIWGTASRVKTAVAGAFSTAVDYKYRTAIAAALTLLIVATIVLFNITKTSSPSLLFETYFVPFENQGNQVLRGDNEKGVSSETELIQGALSEYDKGNYANAIQIFDQIPGHSGNLVTVWMYKGNAYLHEDETDMAKQMFQNIIDENAGVVLQAKWYLSLCHLKEGEIDQARPYLEEIRDVGGYKSKEAKEILSDL